MSIPSQREAGPDLNTETLTQIARINANLGGEHLTVNLRVAGPDWGSQVRKLVAMTLYYSLTRLYDRAVTPSKVINDPTESMKRIHQLYVVARMTLGDSRSGDDNIWVRVSPQWMNQKS